RHRPGDQDLLPYDLVSDPIKNILPNSFLQQSGPFFVVFCSGYGSPDRCAQDPEQSRKVDVDKVCQLVQDLEPFEARPVYLSSSLVFSGNQGPYQETDETGPLTTYGRLKRKVEIFLEKKSHALILRLDKIVGDDGDSQHLFQEWVTAAKGGNPIVCIKNQM